MKKIFFALAALVAMTMTSCVRDESSYFHLTDVKGVVINEVYTFSNQSEIEDLDWIELSNTTNEDIDLTDVLMWEGGGSEEAWKFPEGSVIKAKGFFLVECDKYGLHSNPVKYPAWGLSKGPDEFVVLANSDYKVIDEVKLPSLNEGETYGRVTDGDAKWQIFQAGTPGAKNEGPARGEFVNTSGLFINEVYHDNSDIFDAASWDPSVDFIEIYNSTDQPMDISGFEVYDDTETDEKKYVVPEGTVIPAKGFLTWDVYKENLNGPAFGLGAGGDWVFIYKPGKSELVDKIEIPAFAKDSGLRDNGYTVGRKPDGSATLVIFKEATKNASNNDAEVLREITAPEQPGQPEEPGQPDQPVVPAKVVFNELCGNKVEYSAFDGKNKFIELYNAGTEEVSLEGWTIRKYASDATDVAGVYNNCWVAVEGIKIAAGGYLVLAADQEDPALGFNAGLSAKKGVKFELVDPQGNVVDKFVRGEDVDPFGEEPLSENKEASYSRVPNGTGTFAYAAPTPGAANGESTGEIEGYTPSETPSTPSEPEKPAKAEVVFNELCGNKAYDGQKFIELYNLGTAEVDLKGWTIRKYAADAVDVAGKYNNCWVAVDGIKIAAGGYLVLAADQTDPTLGFNAGLSAKKGVKFELVDPQGNVVDKFVRGTDADPFEEEPLSENKEASYSRVPNGTGDWAYAAPTPGAANGEKTEDIEGYNK